ncbi:MAG: hypothetical protein K0U98_20835 [Deltaproteobacteria bacterium]|nr:hypothetical protein [Deltaproteobacteria bacterium]
MKRAARFGLILLLSTCLAPLCFAAPDEQRDPISIDVVGAPLADVLAGFGDMTESRLSLDPALTASITLRLDRVSWTTALDAVCESAGCNWSLVGGPPRVLKIEADPRGASEEGVGERLEVAFVDLPRAEALRLLVGTAGLEAGIEGELTGSLSMNLQGVTLGTALKALCEPVGCLWRFAKKSTPPIFVFPRSLGDRTEEIATADARAIELAEASGIEEKLRTPLSLSLRDAPLSAVLKSFGNILGCGVSIAPGLEASVTVELDKVPAADALDKVCLLVNCRWRFSAEGEPTLFVEK